MASQIESLCPDAIPILKGIILNAKILFYAKENNAVKLVYPIILKIYEHQFDLLVTRVTNPVLKNAAKTIVKKFKKLSKKFTGSKIDVLEFELFGLYASKLLANALG